MQQHSFARAIAAAIIMLLAGCNSAGYNGAAPSVSGSQSQSQKLSQSGRIVRYKVKDLGTFGGPSAYGSINGLGSRVLDNRGIAAAFADTALPDPLCFVQDCFAAHAFRWQSGVLMDLGVLPGGDFSAAGDVNAQGWVIGQSGNGQIDLPLFGGVSAVRAVLWRNGSMSDLGTLGGATSVATELNDGGRVAGFSDTTTPDPFFGVQIHDFVWDGGQLRDIGTLGGPDTLPITPEGCGTCINNRGQIAGASFTNATPNAVTGVPTYDPFLWENGHMTDLGTLGGTFGGPYSMNDAGQVVGISDVAGDLTAHPFLWDHGVMRDLGTLGGDNGVASWINEKGDVAGYADLPGSNVHHAFLWKGGVKTDLGTLGANSAAFAINSNDQLVGRSRVNDTTIHAFLWENGGPLKDLNNLVPAGSSFVIVDASNINDAGEIFASGAPLTLPPLPEQTGDHDLLLVPCSANCESVALGADRLSSQIQARHTSVSPATSLRARFARRFHIPAVAALRNP